MELYAFFLNTKLMVQIMNINIIERNVIENSLTTEISLLLAKNAFILMSGDKIIQPLRNIITSETGSLMGTMPGYIKEGEYKGFGLKTAKVDFEHGDQQTSHEGCILLYDSPSVGEIAIVDAASITEIRTAAASAVATDILAEANSTTLAILGTGVQARIHAKMISKIRPIQKISIWGRNEQNAQEFANWCEKELELSTNVVKTYKEAVIDANIICTVTASKYPFIKSSELPERCHINAVGASTLGFQEFFSDIYSEVDLYVDSMKAVMSSSSSFIEYKEKNLIDSNYSMTEIGELLISKIKPNRRYPKTMFKSIGLAVQDLVFAKYVASLSD